MSDTKVTGTWNGGDNMFFGNWIHRDTGEKITITNSLINENNQMILMTSIGQLTMDELSRYYIQDTDEEVKTEISEQPILNDNETNYLLQEDRDLLDRKISSQPKQIEQKVNITKNKDILDKFFNDNKNISLNINVNFDFNEDELKTIMKYTDVTEDDISEYIYEYIVNKEKIKSEINNLLLNKLKD